MTADRIDINEGLSIPVSELNFRASRAGGPGGQHVNTSSTRVELLWDVRASGAISEEQRSLILERLASRINAEGVLTIASSVTRSQLRNREDAVRRFANLLRAALHQPKERRRTGTPRAAREARLREKRQRSEIKKLRRRPPLD